MDKLHKYAREHALSFEITYSECEDNWCIHMTGIAHNPKTLEKESFYCKKIHSLEQAIEYVIRDADKFYNDL